MTAGKRKEQKMNRLLTKPATPIHVTADHFLVDEPAKG
jgi:hypothetical protein